MASNDDDLIYKLFHEADGKDDDLPKLRPEEPRSEEKETKPPAAEVPFEEPLLDDADGNYEVEREPDQGQEIAKNIHERQRRKRSRSVLKADQPTSPFTVKQGWLDDLFTIPFLAITMAVAFFLFPLVLPVAVLGAITAHDWEARRGALLVMGFCFFPVLVGCCIYGMAAK